ncbi:hypothetical protein AVEN_26668-1, partial [Araneus ventricosus]
TIFWQHTCLSVADPKLLREILVKQFPSFVNRRISYVLSGDPLMDSMLFFLRGQEWKRVRGILTPNFTTGKIKKMINILKNVPDNGRNQNSPKVPNHLRLNSKL